MDGSGQNPGEEKFKIGKVVKSLLNTRTASREIVSKFGISQPAWTITVVCLFMETCFPGAFFIEETVDIDLGT